MNFDTNTYMRMYMCMYMSCMYRWGIIKRASTREIRNTVCRFSDFRAWEID
jgi:hypothetical protein